MSENSAGDLLIVDDERVLADTLSIILNRCGIPTRTAYDGDLAIKAIEEREPKVVLMNVGMPHSGVEAALQIRATHPNIRVVMHTGSEGNLRWAAEEGLTDLIIKPIHPQDLMPILEEYGFRIKRTAAPAAPKEAVNTRDPQQQPSSTKPPASSQGHTEVTAKTALCTRILKWLGRR
jgi:CheY-like chemotaxis protein